MLQIITSNANCHEPMFPNSVWYKYVIIIPEIEPINARKNVNTIQHETNWGVARIFGSKNSSFVPSFIDGRYSPTNSGLHVHYYYMHRLSRTQKIKTFLKYDVPNSDA